MAQDTSHDHTHGLDPELPLLTTTVEKLVQWARRSAIWTGSQNSCCGSKVTSSTKKAKDIYGLSATRPGRWEP